MYQKAQGIFEALVKQDSENTEFQRGLLVSFYKLANVYEASKNFTLALANMKLAYGQIVRMRESGILAADDVKYIDEIKTKVQRLESLK